MISKKEIKTLIPLLGRIQQPEEGLPLEVFEVLTKIVPFVACELVIRNEEGGLLLTYREDKFWTGWHFPGGLMRFNDTFKKRLELVVKNELRSNLKAHKFLFPINYSYPKQNPRGHVVSLVFLCELAVKPKVGTLFTSMPSDIVNDHKRL